MSATEPAAAAAAPDVDVAIRKLLDQQADIESRLSVLLASHHRLEIPLELSMLRQKLRILEDLVNRHGTLRFIYIWTPNLCLRADCCFL